MRALACASSVATSASTLGAWAAGHQSAGLRAHPEGHCIPVGAGRGPPDLSLTSATPKHSPPEEERAEPRAFTFRTFLQLPL